MTTTTTTPQTAKELSDLVANAPEGTPTAVVGPMLLEALYELESLERQMMSALQQIERDTERAREALTLGGHLNPSGQFQRDPINFDTMCAQRDEQVMTIKRLAFAINKGEGCDIDNPVVDRDALFAELAGKAGR